MGVVYAARDPDLGRIVALKLLHEDEAEAADVRKRHRARLLREARAMARLTHPNVATVFDVGTLPNGQVWVAIEFIKGRTLKRWLGERARSVAEVVEVFLAAGRGLVAAHELRIVHRDFKPENVLVGEDGRVVVTNFGLASVDDTDTDVAPETTTGSRRRPDRDVERLTETGALQGTPAYMAPEQFLGEATDGRTDQFSFSVAFHEALVGVLPFRANSGSELIEAVTKGQLCLDAAERLSPGLQAILRRGLSRQPADRYASMSDLLLAIRERAEPKPLRPSRARYEIVGPFASGGMGELELARAVGLYGFEKLVVIKRIRAQRTPDPRTLERFLHEARLAALLEHPNIVQVFDVGVDAQGHFFAMEFVHGRDLHTLLAATRVLGYPIPTAVSLYVARELASALAYAHTRRGARGEPLGLVHRDVSPSNVLLGYEGAVKLVDFGTAKSALDERRTTEDRPRGKLAYMAPEQVRGEQLDARSDLYSFGTLLFQLLTGSRPFGDLSEPELVARLAAGAAVDVASAELGEARSMVPILTRTLAPAREDRYQTAAELQRDIEAAAVQAGLALSGAELRAFMHRVFEQELSEWTAAEARGVTLANHLVSSAQVALPPWGTESASLPAGEAPRARRVRPGRGRLSIVLVAAVTVLLVVGVALGRWMLVRSASERIGAGPSLLPDAAVLAPLASGSPPPTPGSLPLAAAREEVSAPDANPPSRRVNAAVVRQRPGVATKRRAPHARTHPSAAKERTWDVNDVLPPP
jgi:serine/threonine protein kinase